MTDLIAKLSKAAGENQYKFANELRYDGFITLRPKYHKDTKEVRAILAEMKAVGWKVAGADKGAILIPPTK